MGGPYLFINMVKSVRHLSLLNNKIIPESRNYSVDMHKVWFMQDVATPYPANRVLGALYENLVIE